MSHSSDDPSSDLISAEAPSAPPPESQESERTSSGQPASPAEDGSIASVPQHRTADHDEAPRLPRRRRRRRRPPRAADPAAATATRPDQAEQPAAAESASQSGDLAAAQPPGDQPRRRRRRHRGPRRDAGSAEVKADEAAQPAEGAPETPLNFARPHNDAEENGASQSAAPNNREPLEGQPHGQPRRRRRRRRPPHPAEASATEATKTVAASPAEDTPTGTPRSPYRGVRDRRSRDERLPERRPVGDNRGSPDRRARGNGPPTRKGRPQRGDRDPPRKKPEQRLYALEAIVDRGFEDVVDAAEDNLTRRVHWTITKRTVADQESGKPISATYVLKRDGVDTEFPGLSAARAAVNKTIVHPEKLTLSKAEHAAEHAAAKK
jgi:hypothetical protein